MDYKVLATTSGDRDGSSFFSVLHQVIARDGWVKHVMEAVRFPLSLGLRWEYRFETLGGNPQEVFTNEMKAKVVGWEEVTVSAGTFRSIKVEHYGRWIGQTTGLSGSRETIFWYVPDIGIVREQMKTYISGSRLAYQGERRLVKYALPPDTAVKISPPQ